MAAAYLVFPFTRKDLFTKSCRIIGAPAHIKSILVGPSLTIPVSDGHLALGTWQGIYLCEHRNRGGGRRIVATLQGRW